jgi:hypothetical protein
MVFFFLGANFGNLATIIKKGAGKFNKGILKIFLKNSPDFDFKKLRTRQI